MNWLSQNWIWVAFALGILGWLLRGRHAGHRHAGGAGGLSRALGGHHGHGAHYDGGDDDRRSPMVAEVPEAAVDPVGGEAVRTAQALTSVYRGRIYYFASRENRDRFEAAPDEFAHKAGGHPLRAAEATSHRTRRRRGC
jgi:YHS domain-containing protein